MFEVVLSMCLLAQPTDCRDVLVPGYETATRAACEQNLSSLPKNLTEPASEEIQTGDVKCVRTGESAAFEEAAPGVFVHKGHVSDADADNLGDVANVGFVVGETSIAVIDAGGSRVVGEQIYRAVREKSDLPITHVILTHMHPDHVLGASVFTEAGAQIVGHSGLENALADRADSYLEAFGRRIGAANFIGTRIVMPNITVDERLTIDLGNRPLELQIWPRAHTNNDLTVLDTQSGLLFTGDLVFHEHTPTLDGSLLGWQDVLRDMAELDVKRIVPGHGGPVLSWPSASEPMLRYMAVLERDTRAALDKGISLGKAAEVIAQSEAANWMLFGLFNPRNATIAYTELEWE